MDTKTQGRLTALEAEVARLRGDARRGKRAGLWWRRGAALAVAGTLALTPLLGLAASPTFSDLDQAATEHRGNIQAIGNVGITTGFADPNNPNARLYNPKGSVTREEMASFLARTAGLGSNPPVANAATLQGYAANALIRANGFGLATTNPAPDIVIQPVGTDITTRLRRTTLGATSIQAPGRGYIIVRGAVSVNASGGTIVAVYLEQNPNASGPVSPFFRATVPAGQSGWVTLSPSAIFPVTAGGQNFSLQATAVGDTNAGFANADGITLDAIFVPFGEFGGAGAPTAP